MSIGETIYAVFCFLVIYYDIHLLHSKLDRIERKLEEKK